MFLFSLEHEVTSLDRVRAELRRAGQLHELREGGFVALWAEDRFTAASWGRTRRIDSARPAIDASPVCSFLWRPASGKIVLRRQWSGEFAAYFWREPFVVASHLRLAALAFGALPISAVRLGPSETLQAHIHGRHQVRLSIVRKSSLRERFTYSRPQTVARA